MENTRELQLSSRLSDYISFIQALKTDFKNKIEQLDKIEKDMIKLNSDVLQYGIREEQEGNNADLEETKQVEVVEEQELEEQEEQEEEVEEQEKEAENKDGLDLIKNMIMAPADVCKLEKYIDIEISQIKNRILNDDDYYQHHLGHYKGPEKW